MSKITDIFNNRKLIWEGLKNRTFKQDHIEAISEERMSICRQCVLYDLSGTGCAIKGTQPCCNSLFVDMDVIDKIEKRGCGCSLSIKTRSLSSNCPLSKWLAVTTEQEEEMIKIQLINDEAKNKR